RCAPTIEPAAITNNEPTSTPISFRTVEDEAGTPQASRQPGWRRQIGRRQQEPAQTAERRRVHQERGAAPSAPGSGGLETLAGIEQANLAAELIAEPGFEA